MELGTLDHNRVSGSHIDGYFSSSSSGGGMTPVYEFSSPSNTPACDLTRLNKHSPSSSSGGGMTPVYEFSSPSNTPACDLIRRVNIRLAARPEAG